MLPVLEQMLVNGIVAGVSYAVIGLGFSLVLESARFFHFGHGACYAWGAYFVYLFMVLLRWSPLVSIPLALACSALLGAGMMAAIYLPLRSRSGSSTAMLIASIGLYVVLLNLLSLAFGENLHSLRRGDVQEGLRLGTARITTIQLVIVAIGSMTIASVWCLLRFTRLGLQYRAFANDEFLAQTVGVRSVEVVPAAFVLGSLLAGGAGILFAFDTGVVPTMGFQALLVSFVVVIIGGRGSIPGVLLGGLLVGLARHLGVWKLPAQWQDAVVFALLILFLLLRPQGFLGRPLRKAAI